VKSSTVHVGGQAGPQEIPDRLYFRIGDVSKLAGVKPYVLRYWESEFPSISPKKSGTGQRLYRRKDVELILEIKHLLYEKRYTIEGARKALEARGKTPTPNQPAPIQQPDLFAPENGVDLGSIRRELQSLLDLLAAPPKR
jgi:DNA-binding transcriptional MerR regulator